MYKGILSALLVAAAAGLARGDGYGPRQYYSGWYGHPQKAYHYRLYYYKPTPKYHAYKHHYVIRVPKDKKHLYYYNPYKKQYWGRCPIENSKQPVYSLLPPNQRKANLEEIPEEAFPEPGDLPPVPEAMDDAVLELPPDDLPAAELPG